MADHTHDHIHTLEARVKVWLGIYDENDPLTTDWSKIVGELKLGSLIEIHWSERWDREIDRGVVFSLPGELHDEDVEMCGIVYVPDPWQDDGPIWIVLGDLLAMEDVVKVKVVG